MVSHREKSSARGGRGGKQTGGTFVKNVRENTQKADQKRGEFISHGWCLTGVLRKGQEKGRKPAALRGRKPKSLENPSRKGRTSRVNWGTG